MLGHFLGVKDLGIYQIGMKFTAIIFGIFLNPLNPIVYSVFSRLQSDLVELKQLFLKITKAAAFISLPIGVGLAVLAKPISCLIFGQKWYGIDIVIALIGITDAISWLYGINAEIYRSLGRADINSKILMVEMVYYVPVYFLAAPRGLFVFCLARLVMSIINMALNIFVMNKLINLPYSYIYTRAKTPLICCIIFAIIIYPLANMAGVFQGLQGWIKLIEIVAAGGLIYILGLWFLQRKSVLQFWKFIMYRTELT